MLATIPVSLFLLWFPSAPSQANSSDLSEKISQLAALSESAPESCLERGRELLRELKEAPPPAQAAQIRYHLGSAAFKLHRYQEACLELDRARALASEADRPDLLKVSQSRLAVCCQILGDAPRALDLYRELGSSGPPRRRRAVHRASCQQPRHDSPTSRRLREGDRMLRAWPSNHRGDRRGNADRQAAQQHRHRPQ